MVIAKILPAKGYSFNGVAYNEKKQEEEKSMLLEAKNFTGLDKDTSSQKDYVMYLQAQTKKNSRIKKPQFHATISSKGKEKSFEELQEFANHYMSEMGYGNNPYLVYAHSDTQNNHLHIVSTRVDNQGKKITDSYEKMRSQEIVNTYYGLDYQKELNTSLRDINEYNIQTLSHYKLLLEQSKHKLKETDKSFTLYKSNVSVEIPKEKINEKISENKKFYKFNKIKDRKETIKEAIIELSKNNELKNIPLVTNKEDFEVVLFKAKDKENFYGYSVIDHQSKSVFKGSDIISLSKLEEVKVTRAKEAQLKTIIDSYKKEGTTLKELNGFLRASQGLEVDYKGNVYNIDEKGARATKTLDLSKEYLTPFLYKTRIELANKYNASSELDKKILSHLFNVRKEDIQADASPLNKRQKEVLENYYNDTLRFFVQTNEAKNLLDKSGINLFKIGPEFYLTDKDNDTILHINLEDKTQKHILENGLYTELNQMSREQKQEHPYDLAEALSHILEDVEGNDGKKKKKKKSRNQNREY